MFDQLTSYLVNEKNLTSEQLRLFSELCNIFIEFKIDNEPPSSAVVALAANSGASLPHALSAGLSCISSEHLPIEQIAFFIRENYRKDAAQVFIENSSNKIPGFGHPSIKGIDPRVTYLLKNFTHLKRDHTNFCIKLEQYVPVPMNIGCAIAALSLDNGIDPSNCLFLPLMGRMFGWLKLYNKTKNKFNKVVPSFENIKNEHTPISDPSQSVN